MTAFKVPADLADKPITITQAMEIIEGRREAKRLLKRATTLRERSDELADQAKAINARETEILASAKGDG